MQAYGEDGCLKHGLEDRALVLRVTRSSQDCVWVDPLCGLLHVVPIHTIDKAVLPTHLGELGQSNPSKSVVAMR